MIKAIVCLLGLSFSASILADTLASTDTAVIASSGATTTLANSSNTATVPVSSNTAPLPQSNAKEPVSLIQYCPSADQLVKDPNALTWSAAGGWQGYQQSFSTQIGQFTGVQWAGIQIGQVICTYAAREKDSFPIQLIYNKLVFQPSGGAWGQNLGGYINCKSSNVADCPFPVKLTQKEDVMQEASEIRPTAPQEQAF